MNRSLCLVVLLAAPAAAAWQDIPATDFSVAPPPAPGSPADKADFAELLKDQNSPRDAQCAEALKQKVPDFSSLYSDSGILTPDEMSRASSFMNEVSQYASKVSGYFKKEYHRPRPYNEDPRVQPCADKPSGATSYPSTHATVGALDACVLGRIFPDRAQALADYGKSLGDLRVIVGVHHPSDVAAGQDLAAQICGRLGSEPDFMSELATVKGGL